MIQSHSSTKIADIVLLALSTALLTSLLTSQNSFAQASNSPLPPTTGDFGPRGAHTAPIGDFDRTLRRPPRNYNPIWRKDKPAARPSRPDNSLIPLNLKDDEAPNGVPFMPKVFDLPEDTNTTNKSLNDQGKDPFRADLRPPAAKKSIPADNKPKNENNKDFAKAEKPKSKKP